MGPRPAAHERREWPFAADEERVRQPRRHDNAERVAVLGRVLSGDVSGIAGDDERDRPAFAFELGEPIVDRRRVGHTSGELVAREVAETEQQVVHAVGMTGRAVGREMLQVELELGERIRIEQLAKLGLAEERAQLRRVDGQRLRPSLREWRVALVDEVADVGEEEGGRERRRCP